MHQQQHTLYVYSYKNEEEIGVKYTQQEETFAFQQSALVFC